MSNLSVIPDVKVETVITLGSVIISSGYQTTVACLRCGKPKAIYAYFGGNKDIVFQAGSCHCQNAPDRGGDTAVLSSAIEIEQRFLLSNLWHSQSLEALRSAIPLTPARNKYQPAFRNMLEKAFNAPTLEKARSILELYASAAEMRGVQ